MKIIYLFTALTWYRMELFRSISRQADLHVFILNDAPKGYSGIDYDTSADTYEINMTILSKEKSSFGNLVKILDKENFDAIVVPSMNSAFYLILTSKLARYYTRKGRRVLYFWEYWPMEKTKSSMPKKIKQSIRHWFVRFNNAYITRFIVPSINTYSFYQRMGIPANKMIRCLNSSEVAVYPKQNMNIRERLDIPIEDRVILFLGRLEEYKGINELIAVFESVDIKTWHLVICGPGNVVTRNNRVHYVGSITPQSRCFYFSCADIFVLPNTCKGKVEPWGLTVNEALAFGVPVLATDATGSARDLVFQGINGYIMDSQDLKSELEYYLKLVLLDEKHLNKLKENCKKTVELYSFDNMATAFVTAARH